MLSGVFDHKPGCKAPDYGECTCKSKHPIQEAIEYVGSLKDRIRGLQRELAELRARPSAEELQAQDMVLRCFKCKGTVLYKRSTEDVVFYHVCNSPPELADLGHWLVLKEAQVKALEAERGIVNWLEEHATELWTEYGQIDLDARVPGTDNLQTLRDLVAEIQADAQTKEPG